MGKAIYNPGQENRPAWSVGRELGAKRPLLPNQMWAVRFFLEQEPLHLGKGTRVPEMSGCSGEQILPLASTGLLGSGGMAIFAGLQIAQSQKGA